MEVVNSLLRGTIELKRAELILRALNTAVRNIKRVKFGLHSNEMVREIPNYATPPLEQIDQEAAIVKARAEKRAEAERARAEYMADLAATVKDGRVSESPVHVKTVNVSTAAAHVGTDAFVRPGGPEVPGRSTAPQKQVPTTPAEATARKPSVSVKQAPISAKTQAPATARKEAPRSVKTEAQTTDRRKASTSERTVAPKEPRMQPTAQAVGPRTNKEAQAPSGQKKNAIKVQRQNPRHIRLQLLSELN